MATRGRPKGSHDVTPEIRGGLKRFFKIMEDEGTPISTIWRELYEADPVNFMRLAISTMPKEVQADVTTRNIEDFVTGVVAQQNDSADEANIH